MSSAIVAKSSKFYSKENIVLNILKNSNCWIDFSDTSTYTTTGTGNLSLATVTDKSNDARTITVTGTCSFDEATKSMFNLTGTGNYLSVNTGGVDIATDVETVFLVVSQSNNTSNTPSFFGTGTTGARYARFGSGFTYGRFGASLVGGISTLPAGEVIVLSVVVSYGTNGGIIQTFNNGKLDSNQSSTTDFVATGATRIGQTNTTYYQIGNLYEIIFFNSPVANFQRQMIEYYLMNKWKITSSISSPTSITGCTLWLDGNDASTITFSSGTSVSQWNDKSGNNYHAVQATAARQPTYDSTNKGVNFVQANVQFMTSTAPYTGSANNECIYIVFKQTNAANANLIGTTDTARGRQIRTQSSRVVIYNGATLAITGARTLNTTNMHIVEFVNVTGRCLTNINKAVDGNSGKISFASGTWTQVIGGATTSGAVSYDGLIYEIVVFNRELTGSERLSMMNYLFTKWNISAGPTLFSQQPYSTIPPYLRSTLPTDIDACAIWLDAADKSTLTLTGSNVTAWRDKASSNFLSDAIGYGNTTLTTIGRNSAINLDGATTNFVKGGLTGTNSTTLVTVFAVMTMDSTIGTNYQRLFSFVASSSDTTASGLIAIATNGPTGADPRYIISQRSTVIGVSTIPVVYDTPTIVCVVSNRGNLSMYINSQLAVSTTIATSSFAYTSYNISKAGSSSTSAPTNVWKGKLGEIIVYNKPVSVTERQQIEGYLADKWGVKTSLPSTHIFRNELTLSAKFDPKVIDAALWLDASDPNGNGTLPATGSAIATWVDKSGFARSCSQSNVSRRPTFNYDGEYPAITFTGSSSQYLVQTTPGLLLNTNYSIFMVSRSTTASLDIECGFTCLKAVDNSVKIFSNYSSGGDGIIISYLENTTFKNAEAGVVGKKIQVIADNSVLSNTNVYFVNGTSYAGTTTGTTANVATDVYGYTIGANNTYSGGLLYSRYLNGYVYEIIVVLSVPSNMKRQQIEGYLAWKWGMQANLPSTHAYAKYPPY